MLGWRSGHVTPAWKYNHALGKDTLRKMRHGEYKPLLDVSIHKYRILIR